MHRGVKKLLEFVENLPRQSGGSILLTSVMEQNRKCNTPMQTDADHAECELVHISLVVIVSNKTTFSNSVKFCYNFVN